MQYRLLYIFTLLTIPLFAQTDLDSVQKLDEVIIDSKRIALPFIENSHTIEVMDSLEMLVYATTSVDEMLQNMNGIDVRRRGVEGTQSDLYIRGGSFEQVLLLIDGVKMDDLQTGHHSMNGIIDPENIERIEVIKGAASRIYGQNAMNGAVNIITKKANTNQGFARFNAGYFETYGAGVGYNSQLEQGAIQFSLNKLKSDGYRYNTDFNNWNGFFKANFGNNELLATYGERAFGANGFYASPLLKDQYEETQTSMLAYKRKMNFNQIKSNAQLYWRRNEDYFILKRNLPEYYQNKHTTQKIGVAWDGSYQYEWLTSALGVDINFGNISSSNLGNHERVTATLYVEERIKTNNGIFDITPGFSVNYYSDFGWYLYPGMDIGAKLTDDFKVYSNIGYTSRIPNFTNLYYNSPSEQGNAALRPEKALTTEVGIYYTPQRFMFNANYFYRHADDLIDWAKDTQADIKWQARNFSNVVTQGVEFSSKYKFKIKEFPQFAKLGYTYMDENIIDKFPVITRYSLNSFRHQVVASWHTQFMEQLSQNISYRFVERTLGETYNVVDAGINWKLKGWSVGVDFNNIFDTNYTETNLVPMPGFHMMGSVMFVF